MFEKAILEMASKDVSILQNRDMFNIIPTFLGRQAVLGFLFLQCQTRPQIRFCVSLFHFYSLSIKKNFEKYFSSYGK